MRRGGGGGGRGTSFTRRAVLPLIHVGFLSQNMSISQLIRFARASSYVTDFNTRNKLLTQKLLKQGYRYHKLRNFFLNCIDDNMI